LLLLLFVCLFVCCCCCCLSFLVAVQVTCTYYVDVNRSSTIPDVTLLCAHHPVSVLGIFRNLGLAHLHRPVQGLSRSRRKRHAGCILHPLPPRPCPDRSFDLAQVQQEGTLDPLHLQQKEQQQQKEVDRSWWWWCVHPAQQLGRWKR
jgi:hypothetical protein